MSGSPFDTLNRDIVNASDRTRQLADSTRWKTMQQNMVKGFGPNPRKRNGYRYQSDFIVSTKGNQGIDQSGCVVTARNYELFQSISRGKYYSNPSLDGAAAGKYDLWFANCLTVAYQVGVYLGPSVIDTAYFASLGPLDLLNLINDILDNIADTGDPFSPRPVDVGNTIPYGFPAGPYFSPILLTNLYASTDISNSPFFHPEISGWSGVRQGYDMIPFPPTCLDDCSYNGLVPGFIEDPSYVIFTRTCIGALAAVARPVQTNLSHTEGWLRGLASIKFRDTPYYWKGVMAQPLNKYSFPKRVPLYYQGPSEQAEYKPMTINGGSMATNDLLEAFCNGCAGFN